jgi:DNA-directed RNA polymerase alpha subunit
MMTEINIEREKKILELRKMDMSYKSIASIFNLSRERIRQIEYRALRRLNWKNHLYDGLTVRSVDALRNLGIETVEDLTNITETKLRRLRNVGEKTVGEIKRFLMVHNIELKQEVIPNE